MWLRSPGWEFDSLSALWREVSTGTFTANDGSNDIDTGGRNGASILLEGTLAPGESRTYPILITWHFPNCYLQDGGSSADCRSSKATPGCRTLPEAAAAAVAPVLRLHLERRPRSRPLRRENYASLRERTLAFKEALFSSTLPPYVLDAVSANLGHPEIADGFAPGEWQHVGLGGLLSRCRLLPWLLHACLELCAGLSPSLPASWSGLCASLNWSAPWMNAAT